LQQIAMQKTFLISIDIKSIPINQTYINFSEKNATVILSFIKLLEYKYGWNFTLWYLMILLFAPSSHGKLSGIINNWHHSNWITLGTWHQIAIDDSHHSHLIINLTLQQIAMPKIFLIPKEIYSTRINQNLFTSKLIFWVPLSAI